MNAVVFHEHGGPGKLQYQEMPMPTIGVDEVLVQVKACALNHLDIWIRQGSPAYPMPLPHILGSDIAGVVHQIGSHVEGVACIRHIEFAHGGVQRREQLVGGVGAGRSEAVEQRALARIGVADDGDRACLRTLALPALGVALAFNPIKALAQGANLPGNQTAVDFELFLAGATQADATALPLKMRPAAYQAGRQMFQLGEFHCQLAFRTAGALGEDVENQCAAVDDAAGKLALKIALLHARQWMVEDHQFSTVFGAGRTNLFNLAATSEERGVRLFAATSDHAGRIRAGSGSQ